MLSGRNAFALAFDGTLGKINGLATLAAGVGLAKLCVAHDHVLEKKDIYGRYYDRRKS